LERRKTKENRKKSRGFGSTGKGLCPHVWNKGNSHKPFQRNGEGLFRTNECKIEERKKNTRIRWVYSSKTEERKKYRK
jgi:hypothetical protein